MSNGDPGWVETRIIILQSHFPDRFLEAGKEWQQCHEDKNCGCFVYARMSADEFERETV